MTLPEGWQPISDFPAAASYKEGIRLQWVGLTEDGKIYPISWQIRSGTYNRKTKEYSYGIHVYNHSGYGLNFIGFRLLQDLIK